MRRVVNGMAYDTKRAILIAHDAYWDGNSFSRKGRNTYLYKTTKGNYFIYRTTAWQGEINTIEPISKEDAKKWYEELPVQEIPYEMAFGETPEEA